MHREVAPDVSLWGRVVGDGPRAVVLVHGWMVSGDVFEAVVPRLDPQRFRIGVVDLRGSGKSSKPDTGYTLEHYVVDLAAWMDAVGMASATLVGHSMGGAIAQLFAATHPERVDRLVLLSPVPLSGMTLPEPVHELFESCAGDRAKQGAVVDMSCLQLTDDDRERMLDIGASVSGPCIRQSLAAWTAGGFEASLPRITAQTHVIGTSDPFLPPEFLTAAVVEPSADATFHLLEGPGHYPMVEAPAETAELLASLL